MVIRRLLTTCFGLGWLPLAPGTWGSLPPAIAFGLVLYFGASWLPVFLVMLVFLIAGSIVCLKLSDASIAATGKSDPREVVADEVAGQALTFMIPKLVISTIPSGLQIIVVAAVGFFFFRVFDIVKPWPVNRLEKLPGGRGILCDDLMAGVYAGIALCLTIQLWMLK